MNQDAQSELRQSQNLKLKIFEKEYYIEHPNDYRVEVRDETDKLLAVPERS